MVGAVTACGKCGAPQRSEGSVYLPEVGGQVVALTGGSVGTAQFNVSAGEGFWACYTARGNNQAAQLVANMADGSSISFGVNNVPTRYVAGGNVISLSWDFNNLTQATIWVWADRDTYQARRCEKPSAARGAT